MEKYVLTVLENVCAENGKPYDAIDLINAMKKYGTVEKYEEVEKRAVAESQKVIDGLTTQLSAIKEFNLTNDEIGMLRAYRQHKAENERVLKAEKEVSDNKLAEMEKVFATTMGKIRDIVG